MAEPFYSYYRMDTGPRPTPVNWADISTVAAPDISFIGIPTEKLSFDEPIDAGGGDIHGAGKLISLDIKNTTPTITITDKIGGEKAIIKRINTGNELTLTNQINKPGTGIVTRTIISTKDGVAAGEGGIITIGQTDGSIILSGTVTPGTLAHNSLSGLQGGAASQYYHLTSAEYSALHSAIVPATSVTNEQSFGISPAVGTGTLYARNDHTHGSPATPVTSFAGRTGAVTTATNDYTWAQIDKTVSSIADITTRSHTALSDIGTNTHAQIDTAVANSVSHIAAASPHSGHEVTSNKGAANGYASLDVSALLPQSQLTTSIPDSNLAQITTASKVAVSAITGTLLLANGGLGFTTAALGDIVYASGTNAIGKLSRGSIGSVLTTDGVSPNEIPTWSGVNITTTKKFLSQTGTGAAAGTPAWDTLADSDIPDTITLTNITQITNRSHTSLSDIGSLTHSTIDGYLDQAVKAASSPTFAGLTVGSISGVVIGTAGVLSALGGGNTTHYLRGDATYQTLNQAAVAGLTTADSPTFTGLTCSSATTPTITVTDTTDGNSLIMSRTDVSALAQITNKVNQPIGTGTNYSVIVAGTDDFISVPDAAPLRLTSAGTLRCWIKRVSGGDAYQVIISRGRLDAMDDTYGLWLKNGTGGGYTDGDIVLYCADAVGSQNKIVGNIGADYTNWHCVQGMWSGTGGGNMWGWVDGVNSSDTLQTRQPTGAAGANVKIGTDENSVYDFNGYIDEVQIHNVAKDDTDAGAFYNSGLGEYGQAETGLVLGLHMDGAASPETDYSSNGYTATASGTVTYQQTGAFSYTGTDVTRTMISSQDGTTNGEAGIVNIGDSTSGDNSVKIYGNVKQIGQSTHTTNYPLLYDGTKFVTNTLLPVGGGGTGLASWTANGILYASGATTLANSSNLTYNGTDIITQGATRGYAIANSNALILKGSGARGVLELQDGGADSDGITIGSIWAVDILNTGNSTDKRIGGFSFIRSGTTAGNRGGLINFFTKADASVGFIPTVMSISNTGAVTIGSLAGLIIGTAGVLSAITYTAWTTWTCTLTNVTEGNGTKVARYCRIGNAVYFYVTFTLGSTSEVTGNISFGLPVAAATSNYPIGQANYIDGGVTYYPGEVYKSGSAAYLWINNVTGTYPVASNVSASAPFDWTTGDIMEFSGWYEVI